MATIYFNKARGKWCINYRLDGTRVRRVVGSKAEAEKLLKKTRAQLELGRLKGPRKSVKVDEFFSFMLDWIKRHKSAPTAKRYTEVLNHFRHFCGERHFGFLADIRPRHIEEYKAWRAPHVGARTISYELATLGHFWRTAIQLEYTEDNPVSRVARPRAVKPPPRYLSRDEIARLLEVSEPYQKAVWTTLLLTGMRRGELEALEWSDIDFKGRTIAVRGRKDWQPKMGQSRGIPMHDDLIPVLEHLPKRSDRLVFCTEEGTSLNHLWRSFKRCCKRAGIENASPHTLRHTFASHLVMAGVDLPTVGEILGHRDITTTMIYAHLATQHLHASIQRLDVL